MIATGAGLKTLTGCSLPVSNDKHLENKKSTLKLQRTKPTQISSDF
jgi:hypothetical protein